MNERHKNGLINYFLSEIYNKSLSGQHLNEQDLITLHWSYKLSNKSDTSVHNVAGITTQMETLNLIEKRAGYYYMKEPGIEVIKLGGWVEYSKREKRVKEHALNKPKWEISAVVISFIALLLGGLNSYLSYKAKNKAEESEAKVDTLQSNIYILQEEVRHAKPLKQTPDTTAKDSL